MHSVFWPATFRRKLAPIAAQLWTGGYPKHQWLSRHKLHDYTLDAGILANGPANSGGNWTSRSETPGLAQGWAELITPGTSSSNCGYPAFGPGPKRPAERSSLMQCTLSPDHPLSVLQHVPSEGSYVLGVQKKTTIRVFTVMFILHQCCWSFIPCLTSAFPKAHVSCWRLMQLALSPHCSAPLLRSTQIVFWVFSQDGNVYIWAKQEFFEGKTVECRLCL